ncbi:ribosome biogenesis GTP-binding protein YihA/YsxC [Aquisalinus flavus]|uniref:Probable GTP-binding protein EngB n=1 Tax=Aquisalinus flavus TaxID=1526572 RepID=A0A8J2V0Y1_9PROT|nr:ribosome biogenesis GTP-binding protein YihA/YsxC [Aquisalinus flavus]MBD0426900.1 YihA family ribosome biogenesis GTP-binding protein [Aquisalinus flavus]UNE46744.1 YihA family ribosome biogenesis GTP-binding protein [Aquisalinus flavus]GGC96838.1 putative GTP-binding protein EngB [Aquisalinus flavus]
MTDTTYSDDDIETGRVLFAGPCDFMLGVVSMETLPPPVMPEVAFAGRSNVGKSSLLNAITGRKALARTSNTPGRTRELNFFNLNDRLRLVDLPGYGYARASKKESSGWNRLIRDYLKGRVTLRRVCLLIDSRHGLKDNDAEIMKMLDIAAVPYQIVLTKTDKIKPTDLEKLIAKTAEKIARRPAAFPFIAATSSEKGFGIPELRVGLAQLAE